MNRFWKEELENKLKNKVFFWDEKAKLWRNAVAPEDSMTNNEYEAISYTLELLGENPLP
jgi:hypothetical protein